MGKMKELFIEQQLSGSIGGDEDYLYEQYLKEKEYWDSIHSGSIFPPDFEYDDEYYKSTYTPTPDEEEQNFKQLKK